MEEPEGRRAAPDVVGGVTKCVSGANRSQGSEGIQIVSVMTRGLTERVEMESRHAREATDFGRDVRPLMPVAVRLAARLGSPQAADDIVQEALIRAWRYRGRFDPLRGSFSGWVLAIVANEARRASARTRRTIEVEPTINSESSDLRVDIARAVARLSTRQRLAVDCYYYAGLSIGDTAAVMKCSEGTVKSTLADARARLRALLVGLE